MVSLNTNKSSSSSSSSSSYIITGPRPPGADLKKKLIHMLKFGREVK
jgi:hypothetical protein